MTHSSDSQRNWKGTSQQTIATVQHRWQTEQGKDSRDVFKSPQRRLNRILLFLLTGATGLLVVFVYLLLHSPTKTPVIAVAATNYTWPLPPNAWAKEDLIALGSLNGRTIQLIDSTSAWQTRSSSLDDLRTQLKLVAGLSKRTGALVLYLNMHGAVNEDGVACLIPPGANALTTTQWLTIDEIVNVLRTNTGNSVKVLVALDCVHQKVNWNIGQITNTFVERLEAWIATNADDRITFIVSSAPDQQTWGGAELHGTVFGREFCLGLAGQADQKSRNGKIGFGNENGSVDLQELVSYLGSNVQRWSDQARGVSQMPKVMPVRSQDFPIAWALKSWELSRRVSQSNHKDLVKPNVPIESMSEIWRLLAELRELELFRMDPKSWAELENKATWLEQLSNAGTAYAELASKRVQPELTKRLKNSLDRARSAYAGNDFFAKSRVLQSNYGGERSTLPLPSLALMQFTGAVTDSVAIEARQRLARASTSDLDVSLTSIGAMVSSAPNLIFWNELNYLGIVRKFECQDLWKDKSIVNNLMELRDRCERDAVFGDVRGHQWRRNQLAGADRLRRIAEDKLILGPESETGDKGSSVWLDFGSELDALESKSDGFAARIDRALGLRDRGLAEISHFAKWICSPNTQFENLGDWKQIAGSMTDAEGLIALSDVSNVDTFLREKLAIQQLARLVEGLHDLGDIIGSVEGKDNFTRLDELVANVTRDLESIRNLVNDHVRLALREETTSDSKIREIQALLELPFLDTKDRIDLQNKMEELARLSLKSESDASNNPLGQSAIQKWRNGPGSIPGPDVATASAQSKRMRYVDRIRSWESHPLGVLLKIKNALSIESAARSLPEASQKESTRELNAIDLVNEQLRRHYQSMLTFSAQEVFEWVSNMGIQESLNADSDTWTKYWIAEHFERTLAPICPIKSEWYATADVRSIAFKDLLVWYANRTLDDFYANAMVSTRDAYSSQTYFEVAVDELLDYANAIPVSSGKLDTAIKEIQKRVKVMGPIARNGLRTTAKLGPPGLKSDSRVFEISLQPTISSQKWDSDWRLPLPPGMATAFFRTERGIVANARAQIPMPPMDTQSSYPLTWTGFDPGSSYETVVAFRGHEFKTPIHASHGMFVDFEPYRYDRGQVILFGDRQRQPSIVFVLDCSWSMGEEIPVEAVGLRTQSRLELAKESILRMLAQIASRPDARVGVRLFGHRMGWSRPMDEKKGIATGKSQILVQPNYPFSIPDDLVPSKDVEAILPLGRFTQEMLGPLSNTLSKVVPWGQSPLYLSIIDSFNDFAADNDSTAKSIVVITDGDNFQFNASNRPGGEPGSYTTLDTVYRAWNSAEIPVFILGVGISDKENPNSRKTLQELAEQTKGKYYETENGSELVRALSEQLSLGTYEVTRTSQNLRGKKDSEKSESKLNSPIELKGPSPGQEAYTLAFQSIEKQFKIQGGESLEMFVTNDGQGIISKPFDRFSPRSGTLVRGGEPGRMIARVHRPSKQANNVVFPVSIQDPDSHFTARPAELWVEVLPISERVDTLQKPYVFFDTNYDPGTTVPLISWTATNWPVSATKADVRVWAKYTTTTPLETIKLADIQKDPQRFASGEVIRGVDGVKLAISMADRSEIDGYELQVSEIHSERSLGVGSIGVYLESDDGLPSRVTHRFEHENGLAIHTFEFKSKLDRPKPPFPSGRLIIRTRSSIQDAAWQLQGGQPIRVDVRKPQDSLQVTAKPSVNNSSPKN